MWQSAGIRRLLSSSDRLYLDHAATTPVLPEARAAMARALEAWANPSSPHAEGRAARALLEEARATIAEVLGWRHDVIFTSGASEAIEIAARAREGRRAGARRDRASRSSAMRWARSSTVIPVDARRPDRRSRARRGPGRRAGAGRDPAGQQRDRRDPAARPARADDPRRRVAAARRLRAERGQAAACPTPTSSPPAPTSSAGRRASACCWSRDLATLEAVGGQEKGYRRGTQDAPAALGLRRGARGAAVRHGAARGAAARGSRRASKAAGGVVIAEGSPRIPTIGAIALPGASSASLLVQFDLAGIAVSAGSACSSGKHEGERGARGDGRRAGNRRRLPPGQLRAATRARPTSTASSPNGGGSPSAPRPQAA